MARSCGPGKDSGKSTTNRSGPVTACTAGATRWLVSISISLAPPTFSTDTWRIRPVRPEPVRHGGYNMANAGIVTAALTPKVEIQAANLPGAVPGAITRDPAAVIA